LTGQVAVWITSLEVRQVFLLIGMFYIEFGDVKVLRMQPELG